MSGRLFGGESRSSILSWLWLERQVRYVAHLVVISFEKKFQLQFNIMSKIQKNHFNKSFHDDGLCFQVVSVS